MKFNKNVLIVGGGIHGCFLAKYLIENNINVCLVEKKNDVCLGSSNATHNRANRGFHYPRSIKTTIECKKGYEYFEKNYKKFLKKTNSFYCIEKKSKVSYKNYTKFFKKKKLKFKEVKKNHFIKNKYLEGVVLGEEGCYNHKGIKSYLKKKLNSKYIKIYFNYNLEKVFFGKKSLKLISSNKKEIIGNFDYVINATYDNTNQTSKLFGIKKKLSKYKHQLTEVVCVKSKRKLPGITVMDGPFATIMPHIGKKNEYLLYDVINSILKTSSKPITKFKKIKSNYLKIKKKLSYYMNYTNELNYKKSFYGNRPIPINDKTADRSTKIINNKLKNNIKFISIREGKYISAPYFTNQICNKIKES